MADRTTASIVVGADQASVMAVIADFPAYPLWAQGVNTTKVIVPGADGGRADQVYFEIEATPIRDSYTLAYDWDDDTSVSWHLVSGQMMRGIDGRYDLAALPDGSTNVTYTLAVDLAIPMIGMLKRKAEKVIVDAALKGLKKRVESL